MQEENEVIVETTNDTVIEETVETPTEPTETTETTEVPEVNVEQLQATNKKLYERAKKAEAEAKALRGKATPVNPSPAPSQSSVEETVLLANGMSEELLGELKAIAQVRKTSLIKAQADPIFVAVKEKFEKDKKQKESSLPASRGSGSVKPKKDFDSPELTRDEHREMFLKAL